MLDKSKIVKTISILSLGLILTQPAQAYAWGNWPDQHRYGWSDHHRNDHFNYRVRRPYPVYGQVVLGLPSGFLSVSFGGSRYYYCDGVYYRPHRQRGYIIVAPPPGVIINALPSDCQPVVINGAVYYTSGDVYYRYTPQGYAVVQPPAVTVVQQPVNVIQQPLPVTTAQPVQVASSNIKNTDESFTINIPNSKGGYTAVALKRSGDGFIGPQGEFYPSFPKIEQLKAMYAED